MLDAGRKHQVAKGIVRSLSQQRSGVLSMQVLQEFYVNVTRKISLTAIEERGAGNNRRLYALVRRNVALQISGRLFLLKTRP